MIIDFFSFTIASNVPPRPQTPSCSNKHPQAMPDTTGSPKPQLATTYGDTQGQTEHETPQIDNDVLETLFDAIDDRTAQQQLLHDRLADGFIALARERYASPSSLQSKVHRETSKNITTNNSLPKLNHHSLTHSVCTNHKKKGLSRLVHDNRQDLRSKLLVQINESTPDYPHAPPIITRYIASDKKAQQAAPSSSEPTLRRRRATQKREEEGATEQGEAAGPQLQGDARNTVMAMPSAEVRDAMRSFREAAEACVEVVNATGRVEQVLGRVAKG